MALIPQVLKNFTGFVDGVGQAGRIEEIELPKLKVKSDDFRAGGMDSSVQIDMGIEKLEAKMTFAEYDPTLFRQLGLIEGADVPLVARGAIQRGNEAAVAVVVTMRGRFSELDMGTWKAGDRGKLMAQISVNYYKLTIGGQTMIEIDIENMVRMIGGIDQLAGQRQALGL